VQCAILAIWIAEGAVGNRGFYDHNPDDMTDWVDAYRSIGADEAAAIVSQASLAMGTIDFDAEDAESEEALLGPIEKRYYALSVDTRSRVVRFIGANLESAVDGLDPYFDPIISRITDARERREAM